MAAVQVAVRGLHELQEKLARAPQEYNRVLADAATLVGDRILNTIGLRRYPPAGPANLPPPPYYIRGRGTQTSETHNLGNSERLGTKFYSLGEVRPAGGTIIRIGNPVSYAPYVIGAEQSRVMARIGWRKLYDVAREKRIEIAKVFEAVIQAALRKVGL